MKITWMVMALLALSSVAIGCKDDEGEEVPEVDCESVDVPSFEEVAIFDKCKTCHDSSKTGAARMSAPTDINFDDVDSAGQHGMKAAEEVAEGEMPPADSNITVTEQEKQQLYAWVMCGD